MTDKIDTAAIQKHEAATRLHYLARAQEHFRKRYGSNLPEDLRSEFEYDLTLLVHSIYREAQEPLTKQLTEFVVAYSRPMLFPEENR